MLRATTDVDTDKEGTGVFFLNLFANNSVGETNLSLTYNNFIKSIKIKIYKETKPYFQLLNDMEVKKDVGSANNYVFLYNPKLKEDGETPAVNFKIKNTNEDIAKVELEKETIMDLSDPVYQQGNLNINILKIGETKISVLYDNLEVSFMLKFV